MSKATRETQMIHWFCDVCEISTTCVDTPTATLAWHDHMTNHARPEMYSVYTWTVLQLDV